MKMLKSGLQEYFCWRRLAIAIMIIAGGLLPVLVYYAWLGCVPTAGPVEARQILKSPTGGPILVDVRPAEKFAESHIDGSTNWPRADIRRDVAVANVPEQFKAAKLLLVCDGGIISSKAVKHLRRAGLTNVMNVRGGIQEWIATAGESEGGRFERLQTRTGQFRPLPVRDMSTFEQLVAVLSGFAIKPTYSVLSLVLIIILWRCRAPDLTALRWSMIFFFVGENFCAANYVLFHETSYLFEYLHSFGMLLSAAFATYAIIEGVDSRVCS